MLLESLIRLPSNYCFTDQSVSVTLPHGWASDTGSELGALAYPSTRMQATLWPGEISRNSGSIRAHSSIAIGQRVRKRHPEGGFLEVGTSPFRMTRSRFSFGSGMGIADSKACV